MHVTYRFVVNIKTQTQRTAVFLYVEFVFGIKFEIKVMVYVT